MNNERQTILACIDGSSLSEAVCDYAAWIAQRVDAPLKLLHTIDHHHETAASTDLSGNIGLDSRDHLLEEISNQEQPHSKLRIQQGKVLLKAAKERVIADGTKDAVTCLQHGALIESLVELEDCMRALVIGVRGKIHENQPDKIGAKLEPMIRSLHRPILVVNKSFSTPRIVMIAYDGSEGSEKAIDLLVQSTLYKGLSCHLVCVSKKVKDEHLLENAATKLRTAGFLDIITANLLGKTEQELCEYQVNHEIDLTIMGAFSHVRLHDLLLGSFTVKMLVNTKTPLLLLR